MGFLKELFEKKLKTSDSKGGASDLEVQRVQSEYTLPQLRTQSPGRDPTSLGYAFGWSTSLNTSESRVVFGEGGINHVLQRFLPNGVSANRSSWTVTKVV